MAGAHADEPVGPRTAVWIAWHVSRQATDWGRDLARRATFWIVPHVNPDGDARNAQWQRRPGDISAYARHMKRELPERDVEFHYPRGTGDRATRRENLAASDFWRTAGGPFDLHASLHSMAFAEGAWYLICREWAARADQRGLLERLARQARAAGLGLHDLERHGEKGFTRIAPGFSTTPRSDAMRDFFLARGDRETAGHFRQSSMEFIQSLGGDPLCIVSEIPMFDMKRARNSNAPPGERPFKRFREMLPSIRSELALGREEPLRHAVAEFGIAPVPWHVQRDLQVGFVWESLKLLD